jgi:hypothetical protein
VKDETQHQEVTPKAKPNANPTSPSSLPSVLTKYARPFSIVPLEHTSSIAQCVTVGKVGGIGDGGVPVRRTANGQDEKDKLRDGDEVCVLGRQGAWLNIEYRRGTGVFNGWSHENYIQYGTAQANQCGPGANLGTFCLTAPIDRNP